MNVRWFIRVGGIFLIIIIIGALTWRNTRELLGGVKLEVTNPINGAEVESGSLLTVRGSGRHIAKLTLNGGKILPDQNGNFEEKIIALKGYNVFEIRAEDRFGREEQKIVQLFGI